MVSEAGAWLTGVLEAGYESSSVYSPTSPRL